MIERRPGYLNGFVGMVPRRITFHGIHGIMDRFRGGSGKGDFEPPPEPPPPSEVPLPPIAGPKPKTIKEYIATHQDKRCPEGERIKTVPCEGADCDPGETEGDCRDDPVYVELAKVGEEEILRKEVKQMELQEGERKREELRQESIRRQMVQEDVLYQRRAQEQAMIQKAAIFGVGGIAVLLVGTLIFKAVSG